MAHPGTTPDQVNGNMQQLQAGQSNLTFLASAISRAQTEKLQLETNLRIFRDEVAVRSKEPVEQFAAQQQQQNQRLAEIDREIQSWENMLAVYRKQYSEKFPDVQTAVNRLAVAKARREALLKEDKENEEAKQKGKQEAVVATRAANPLLQREIRELEANIKRLESAIEVKDLEIGEFNSQMKRPTPAFNSSRAASKQSR